MKTPTLSLCTALALSAAAHGAAVFNPSFEFGTPVFGGPAITDWRLDGHAFVTAENGITPVAGNRMLKFISTSFAGPSTPQGTAASICDVTRSST